MPLYIGVMSGTSLDGLDIALIEQGAAVNLIATHYIPMPEDLRRELLSLCASGPESLLAAHSVPSRAVQGHPRRAHHAAGCTRLRCARWQMRRVAGCGACASHWVHRWRTQSGWSLAASLSQLATESCT